MVTNLHLPAFLNTYNTYIREITSNAKLTNSKPLVYATVYYPQIMSGSVVRLLSPFITFSNTCSDQTTIQIIPHQLLPSDQGHTPEMDQQRANHHMKLRYVEDRFRF